jgi:hypothetical protein
MPVLLKPLECAMFNSEVTASIANHAVPVYLL